MLNLVTAVVVENGFSDAWRAMQQSCLPVFHQRGFLEDACLWTDYRTCNECNKKEARQLEQNLPHKEFSKIWSKYFLCPWVQTPHALPEISRSTSPATPNSAEKKILRIRKPKRRSLQLGWREKRRKSWKISNSSLGLSFFARILLFWVFFLWEKHVGSFLKEKTHVGDLPHHVSVHLMCHLSLNMFHGLSALCWLSFTEKTTNWEVSAWRRS